MILGHFTCIFKTTQVRRSAEFPQPDPDGRLGGRGRPRRPPGAPGAPREPAKAAVRVTFGFANTLEAQNFASRARVFVNFAKLHNPPNPVPAGPAGAQEARLGRNGLAPAARGPKFGNAEPKPTSTTSTGRGLTHVV